MPQNNYTFGDSDEASKRLKLLAEVYEPETRELLQRGPINNPRLAVDLGCGPGWSTRLVKDVLHTNHILGLDSSPRYIEEARRRQTTDLSFAVHDITKAPFPVDLPDVLFCRFLLTHLPSLTQVLTAWASVSAPAALLFIHETESLAADHPVLLRYYELVAEMQRHYGQNLLVGAVLEEHLNNSGWRIFSSEGLALEKSAEQMASLHVANLRTWRHDAFASTAFNPREIDSLEMSLAAIADGRERAGIVINVARQIIANRT